MRYCPNCGEDGEEVLECWQCGASKCEDCATRREVRHQVCRECIEVGVLERQNVGQRGDR